jgi:hypothetical protein
MGLTIHYGLYTPLNRSADVRTLVETLRQLACALPFQEVSPVVEFRGPEADYDQCTMEEYRDLKIQAGKYIHDSGWSYLVKPHHIIAFATCPGEGCAPAYFGLARYPAVVEVAPRSGRQRRLATNFAGWQWASFCDTQRASYPEHGGLANFLRCHLCVIKILDFADRSGLLMLEVYDEGAYWDKRDLRQLSQEVGAATASVPFTRLFPNRANRNDGHKELVIPGFADFEQLAAQGRKRLEKLRRRAKVR